MDDQTGWTESWQRSRGKLQKSVADEPVSRILYGAALASLLRDDHSSSPGLATGIERPTRGFILHPSLRWNKGSSFSRKNSMSRASSPLLFGLAPRGVCLASDIAAEAVGSYPTFSPLPALRSIRRHPEGFPSGYHRDTLRRRYILCGTFRNTAACATTSPGVTRRVALLRLRGVVSGLSSRPIAFATGPAIIQLTRQHHYIVLFRRRNFFIRTLQKQSLEANELFKLGLGEDGNVQFFGLFVL